MDYSQTYFLVTVQHVHVVNAVISKEPIRFINSFLNFLTQYQYPNDFAFLLENVIT